LPHFFFLSNSSAAATGRRDAAYRPSSRPWRAGTEERCRAHSPPPADRRRISPLVGLKRDAGATTTVVVKTNDGTRGGAHMLSGTTAIAPHIASALHDSRRSPSARHIGAFGDLRIQGTPPPVTADPLSIAKFIGDHV
jgi:hypothetical protein